MGRIDQLDLTQRIDGKEYRHRLSAAQHRFLHLRLHLGGQMGAGELGPGLLVVMEGPDASGKGGAIRHLVEPLDPRHFSVYSFSKPSFDEKRHHHLWRFYRGAAGPRRDVRVRPQLVRTGAGRAAGGLRHPEQWGRGYQEINDFETTLVHEGVILIKFWLQISDAEQLRRFESRQHDPLRSWKLTDEDWRNRKRNREYEQAAEDMFARTDHTLAPWDIIAGEQKRLARVTVIERANERIEEGMRRWGWKVPTMPD